MESIVPERKFANCRLCDTLVSSDNPICKNCGLEMSTQGIIELSETEESKGDPIYEIREIKRNSAILIISFSVIGCFFNQTIGTTFCFFPFFGFAVVLNLFNNLGLNQKYLEKEFTKKEFDEITKEKKDSLFVFLASTVFGICLFILTRVLFG